MRFTILALAAAALVWGCATLNPGADPFVVRVEQTQAIASGAFDFVLHVDNADRGFWRTNAPAYHNFCEWLRTPQMYGNTPVSRAVAMQFNVDDLKVAYKGAKSAGNSNILFLAWTTLNTAINQSLSWSNIVATPTHP